MNDPRKQLIVLIAISASFFSFVAGYLLTQPRSHKTGPSEQRATILDRFSESTTETISSDDGLVLIVSDPILGQTNAPNGERVLYYHKNDGTVSSIDIESRKTETVSATILEDLVDVVWAPDKNSVLSLSRSPEGTVYKYFDYKTRRTAALGSDIVAAAFSPDGRSIVLAKIVGPEIHVTIAYPDGSNPETVFKTRLPHVQISWPEDIAITSTDTQGNAALHMLTLDGKLNRVIDSRQNLKTAWSPDGRQLLSSSLDNGRPTLRWLSVAGGVEGVSPISASADLCEWRKAGKSFVCLTEQGGITSIFEVKTKDRSVAVLASNLIVNAKNIFLSNSEAFLAVVSRNDSSLYVIRLPE